MKRKLPYTVDHTKREINGWLIEKSFIPNPRATQILTVLALCPCCGKPRRLPFDFVQEKAGCRGCLKKMQEALQALDPKLREKIALDYNRHRQMCVKYGGVAPTPFAVWLREMLTEGVWNDDEGEWGDIGPSMASALTWFVPDY